MFTLRQQIDVACMRHRATFSPSNCLFAFAMQDIIDPSRTDAVSDKGVPVQHWVPALVNPRAPPVGLFVSEISGIPADTIHFVPATDSRSVRDNPTHLCMYIIYRIGIEPIGKLVWLSWLISMLSSKEGTCILKSQHSCIRAPRLV